MRQQTTIFAAVTSASMRVNVLTVFLRFEGRWPENFKTKNKDFAHSNYFSFFSYVDLVMMRSFDVDSVLGSVCFRV